MENTAGKASLSDKQIICSFYGSETSLWVSGFNYDKNNVIHISFRARNNGVSKLNQYQTFHASE